MTKESAKSIQTIGKNSKTTASPSNLLIRSFSRMKAGLGIIVVIFMVAHLYYNNPMTMDSDLELIANSNFSKTVTNAPTPKEYQKESPIKATIAYATSITKCSESSVIMDQAAILMYSIHKSSVRVPQSGSKYDYDLYVFLHPDAAECKEKLERIGWTVLMKESPIEVEDIRGELKNHVRTASCCGEKEFLKLYSYTLTNYPVVVHFDLDVIMLQPLDELYDSMIDGPSSPSRSRVTAMWQSEPEFPNEIEAFFTRDYNMVNPGSRKPHQIGVQGGFIIVKPNPNYFEEYVQIILEGNYTVGNGWGDKLAYGGFYGAAQIQGLCSYFFGHVRPGTALELNRCVYNSMVDNPFADEPGYGGLCRTTQPVDQCEDCRLTNYSLIKTAHLTVCQKPWWCVGYKAHTKEHKSVWLELHYLCMKMHHAWYKTRKELEFAWSSQDTEYRHITENVTKTLALLYPEMIKTTTLGFCAGGGEKDYFRMEFPKKPINLKVNARL